MDRLRITILIGICAANLWPAESDRTSRGREIYERRCGGCHALDNAKVGPPLRSIVGRRAAADPSFPYSDGLKKAGLMWDEATLDRWLTDPEALVPYNDMGFRLSRAEERSAIFAYLKQLPAKRGRR